MGGGVGGWRGGWRGGYLIPVTTRAPCGANKNNELPSKTPPERIWMQCNMLNANKLSSKTTSRPSILAPIYLDELSSYKDEGQQIITYQDPACDIVFSHQFIASKVEKFGLLIDSCLQCSPFIKHFTDQRSVNDTIAGQNIVWIKFPESLMQNPFPDLTTPITDPSMVTVKQPPH